MVQVRDDIVGLDAAILMAPRVWEASGHLATFTDPLVDCRNCKERFRADQLPESGACPNCGAKDSFTEARQFNLMFKTFVGPVEDDAVGRVPASGDGAGHLRELPERADHHPQEAAVRHRADRQVVPQRDHPGQLHLPHPRVRADGDGVLRARPRTPPSGSSTGARSASTGTSTSASPPSGCACARTRPRSCRTTAAGTSDVEYEYPWGWGELEGIANRTDYDLTQHAEFSGRGPLVLRPGARPALRPARDRAGGRRRPGDARVPPRRLRRGGGHHRGRQGREAHRAAPRSAARADEGRGPAAVEERAAHAAGRRGRRLRSARTS